MEQFSLNDTDHGQPTVLTDQHHRRADMRLVASAIKRRFNIPSDMADGILKRVMEIGLGGRAATNRDIIAAAHLMITAELANQADEHKRQPDLHLYQHVASLDDRRAHLRELIRAEIEKQESDECRTDEPLSNQ